MTDNPKSTVTRRVRTAHSPDKHNDNRDDVVAGLLDPCLPQRHA